MKLNLNHPSNRCWTPYTYSRTLLLTFNRLNLHHNFFQELKIKTSKWIITRNFYIKQLDAFNFFSEKRTKCASRTRFPFHFFFFFSCVNGYPPLLTICLLSTREKWHSIALDVKANQNKPIWIVIVKLV